MPKRKIQADNVLIHRWNHSPSQSPEIRKPNINLPENTAIYEDFEDHHDPSAEPIGVAHTLRKTDKGIEADVQLTINQTQEQLGTLAPAITGETVESEDGEIFKLMEAELDSISLVSTGHEDEELDQNLKQAIEEDQNE